MRLSQYRIRTYDYCCSCSCSCYCCNQSCCENYLQAFLLLFAVIRNVFLIFFVPLFLLLCLYWIKQIEGSARFCIILLDRIILWFSLSFIALVCIRTTGIQQERNSVQFPDSKISKNQIYCFMAEPTGNEIQKIEIVLLCDKYFCAWIHPPKNTDVDLCIDTWEYHNFKIEVSQKFT